MKIKRWLLMKRSNLEVLCWLLAQCLQMLLMTVLRSVSVWLHTDSSVWGPVQLSSQESRGLSGHNAFKSVKSHYRDPWNHGTPQSEITTLSAIMNNEDTVPSNWSFARTIIKTCRNFFILVRQFNNLLIIWTKTSVLRHTTNQNTSGNLKGLVLSGLFHKSTF